MIEGVTIIETTVIPCATWGWSWLGFWLVVAAIAACAIGIVWGCKTENESAAIVITSLTMLCCLWGGLFNFASATKLPDKIQHQILIDEDVPFYLITQNYDIIRQKGNSYIVQEKRPEG